MMIEGKQIIERIKIEIDAFKSEYRKEHIWFRGEGRHFPKMVPSMYRSILSPEKFSSPDATILNFREQEDILEYERWLHDNILEATSTEHLDGYVHRPIQDWNIVYYQQHYGLPTRFMDWAYELQTALYFATSKEEDLGYESRLWLLDPEKFNQLSINASEIRYPNRGEYGRFLNQFRYAAANNIKPVAIIPESPPPVIERIHKQKGTFVFVGLKYTNLRDFIEVAASETKINPQEVLKSITITPEERVAIRQYQIELGIDEAGLGLADGNHFQRFSFENFLSSR